MKILFHIPTGKTAPYNRADNEPVDGLSAEYDVLEITSDPKPTDLAENEYLTQTTGRIGDTWHTSFAIATRQPLPFGPPPITPRQLRLALLQRGLLSSVETALASLPEPQKSAAAIEWEYSSQFLRDHPMVKAIAQAVGVASADLDQLFAEAAAI